MVRKKTKRFSKNVTKSHKKRTRYSDNPGSKQFLNRVLACIYQADKGLAINDLIKKTAGSHSSKNNINETLETLSKQGFIYKSSKKIYSLSKKHHLVEAIIEKNPKGFGFGTKLKFRSVKKELARDPFISASRMSTARHGDLVLLQILKVRQDGRPEAEVISVLERTTQKLPGYFHSRDNHQTVCPDDPRFPFTIIVNPPFQEDINEGDAVIVHLADEPASDQRVYGKIIRVLGNPQMTIVQASLVAEKFSLPTTFSSEAEHEAQTIVPIPGAEHRTDLRDILHYTVDGEDAKDFDDAVAVLKTRKGFRLFVSIADVSAYVKPGSILDKEAYERGTSVYFPGTVIPMLPENLSNNLCSLVPGQDKLTVTVIIDYDRSGRVLKKEYQRSIIQSHQRFTYNTLEQIITEKDQRIRSKYKRFLTPLKWATELAEKLIERRTERGSIGFSIPEANIGLDSEGKVISITRSERHFAHQLIEEFMLAANEAVAQTFSERHISTLFRVHEEPDPEKLSNFVEFSKTLSLQLPKTADKPTWYNHVIDSVRGTPHEYIVNNLLLRTMQQARYSPENKGHFGLALDDYAHFPSPIRRYPDLIVHRLLCNLIKATEIRRQKNKVSPASTLQDDGLHLSERERTAISSERDMADRLKRQFMAGKIGESFQAVITGVSESAFFIELLNIFISGIVPLTTLSDDYYILDEKRHRLIGDISGKTLQMGNIVDVVLTDVDQSRKKILFRLK